MNDWLVPMDHPQPNLDISALPAEERYELAIVLLDSVFTDRAEPAIPPAHLAEVRRRVAELNTHPVPGEPWRDVVSRILASQ